MIVLVAKYYVKNGKGDDVAAVLGQMASAVREQEPGCLLYQVNRSCDQPDLFLLYEQYVDMAALEAHRQTRHFQELIEATIVPLLERRERELYELIIG